MRIPVPVQAVPHVLGIDEFALRRGHRYATFIIDAATGTRVDVLADRTKETVAGWLREHAGLEAVCRDGAGSFAQAVTDAAPRAVQIADRWHLWHLLGGAALKEVLAHSACWAPLGPPIREGRRQVGAPTVVRDCKSFGRGWGKGSTRRSRSVARR
jgi:hypothetical protein